MKLTYTILFTMLFGMMGSVHGQAPNWQWAKAIGGTANDRGEGVAVDASGNIFTTGSFGSTVDFDPGPNTTNLICAGILDGFLLKLDSSGNFVWAIPFGGTGSDVSYGVETDPAGNAYVTGRYSGTVDFDPGTGVSNLVSAGQFDIFVAKFDGSGNLQWAKSMGSQGDDQGFSIALDTAMNIYVSGYFQNTCDFDPSAGAYALTSNGGYDGFVMKLENTGNLFWARSFGGVLFDTALELAVDGSSNVYSTGHYNGMVDFDPGNGVALLPSLSGDDIFVQKLDQGGNYVWAKAMGGVQTDWGFSVATDGTGNAYSTGTFRGVGDFDPGAPAYNLNAFSGGFGDAYTSKLNNTGGFAWAFSTGGYQDDCGNSIAVDADGNIFIAGIFKQTVDFDPGTGIVGVTSSGDNDAFITKTDSAGNFMWTKTFGGQYSEQVFSIDFDPSNRLVATGTFMSLNVAMDNDTLVNSVSGGATGDVFVAKFDSAFTSSMNEADNNFGSFNIYPNPSRDELFISFPGTIQGDMQVEVLDVTGKIVYSVQNTDTRQIRINTISMNNGVYFVRVQSAQKTEVRKFAVNR